MKAFTGMPVEASIVDSLSVETSTVRTSPVEASIVWSLSVEASIAWSLPVRASIVGIFHCVGFHYGGCTCGGFHCRNLPMRASIRKALSLEVSTTETFHMLASTVRILPVEAYPVETSILATLLVRSSIDETSPVKV